MKLINIHVPRGGDPPFPIGYTTKCKVVVEDHKDFGRVFAGTMLATNVTLSLDELFYRTSTTDKKESIRQLSMTKSLKVHNVTVKTELLSLLLSQ